MSLILISSTQYVPGYVLRQRQPVLRRRAESQGSDPLHGLQQDIPPGLRRQGRI